MVRRLNQKLDFIPASVGLEISIELFKDNWISISISTMSGAVTIFMTHLRVFPIILRLILVNLDMNGWQKVRINDIK
jgi:hypothetical protein